MPQSTVMLAPSTSGVLPGDKWVELKSADFVNAIKQSLGEEYRGQDWEIVSINGPVDRMGYFMSVILRKVE